MCSSVPAWRRTSFPDREAWQATVHRVAESDTTEATLGAWAQDFFACGSSAPVRVECEGGAAAWPAGTQVVPRVQGRGLPHRRGHGPLRVFFPAPCSWPSAGLFDQPFSSAPPVQALRRLPCLASFSAVQSVRHIEGPPWLGLTL